MIVCTASQERAMQGSRGFHVPAGLQDLDGKRLEEHGVSGVLSRPRRHNRLAVRGKSYP
jgi:hypothetical protein